MTQAFIIVIVTCIISSYYYCNYIIIFLAAIDYFIHLYAEIIFTNLDVYTEQASMTNI